MVFPAGGESLSARPLFQKGRLAMKNPRFFARHLVLSALGGAVCALLIAALALYIFVGPRILTFAEAWGIIKSVFVEEYDPDAALDAALDGLVDGLGNRWSYYSTAQEYAAQNQRRNNSYVGVGVTVSYEDPRGLLVLSVKKDGPADQGGILPGEVITAADGVSLAGEGQAQGVERITGEEGTTVTLTVLDEAGAQRQVTLTRRTLENDSVTAAELLEGNVGYVKLENFYSHSADQLNAAVDDLVSQGATALVFDMRNNGGGYVSELTAMLDHLLPEGPIFRIQYKEADQVITQSDAECVDLPMAVLVNADTYSAAELFAAQLKETAGAALVGVETSGKGNSQQSFELMNGGALNISTARYTTGAGVSLVGTGVSLDAVVDLTAEEATAYRMGRLAYQDDPQLQKAIELVRAQS